MKRQGVFSLLILVSLFSLGCSATLPAVQPEVEKRFADADVEYVKAIEEADHTWTFSVTVRHPDSGWDDYADGWDVVTPNGIVIKPDDSAKFTRTLLHPHVNEQPFTRSQGELMIPPGVTEVRVRAHDIVDGYWGREITVDLENAVGNDYEVERR